MVVAQPYVGAGIDSERIRRARVGDTHALEELIISHRAFVEGVARRFVSDRDDIEDVAQETWIRAAQALGSLRDEERFRPWLRAIARNACLTFLSRRQPSDSLDEEDAAQPAAREADGPEASAEQRDERRRLWEALGALPELDRRALYLREVEGMPFEELARSLGIRRNAAEVRVHRARARFRQLYEASDATQPACGMAGIRLALLLDGELTGEPGRSVEEHVRSCGHCAQRMRTMAQGRSLYRRMGMFTLPGLSGLLERLQRASDWAIRCLPGEAVPVLTSAATPMAALPPMSAAIATAVLFVAPALASAANAEGPHVPPSPPSAGAVALRANVDAPASPPIDAGDSRYELTYEITRPHRAAEAAEDRDGPKVVPADVSPVQAETAADAPRAAVAPSAPPVPPSQVTVLSSRTAPAPTSTPAPTATSTTTATEPSTSATPATAATTPATTMTTTTSAEPASQVAARSDDDGDGGRGRGRGRESRPAARIQEPIELSQQHGRGGEKRSEGAGGAERPASRPSSEDRRPDHPATAPSGHVSVEGPAAGSDRGNGGRPEADRPEGNQTGNARGEDRREERSGEERGLVSRGDADRGGDNRQLAASLEVGTGRPEERHTSAVTAEMRRDSAAGAQGGNGREPQSRGAGNRGGRMG